MEGGGFTPHSLALASQPASSTAHGPPLHSSTSNRLTWPRSQASKIETGRELGIGNTLCGRRGVAMMVVWRGRRRWRRRGVVVGVINSPLSRCSATLLRHYRPLFPFFHWPPLFLCGEAELFYWLRACRSAAR
jgi:hypothetical protein